MAEEAKQQSIIIKKSNKGRGGHHGGAWKIAYADFVTAMMAFFLLLWLLNSVTQESLEGISNYFAPVSTSQTTSGAGDILGGKTITEKGAAQTATAQDSVTKDLPPPKAGTGGDMSQGEEQSKKDSTEADIETQVANKEQESFEAAKQELEKALETVPQMRQLKNSLLVDNTPEGLRIQLIDRDGHAIGHAMFPSGSANMFLHTKKLLKLVSKVIMTQPQDVSISGHTDATPFNGKDYGNWELSSDRAHSARRALSDFGVPEKRINRVVGKAATEPLIKDNPSHPSNRRLSIILLRGTGLEAQKKKLEDAKRKEKESEALPGLTDIKRNQQKAAPAAPDQPILPAPSMTLPQPGSSPAPSPGQPQEPARPMLPGLNLEFR
ncbi:MAG: flagellar motor protein MotB [Rhodospirillaceae bacterium]